MRDDIPECARCRKKLERGFIPDTAGAGALQSYWTPGVAEWSRWSGLKLKGRPRLPVTAYRCPACGRLELIASPA